MYTINDEAPSLELDPMGYFDALHKKPLEEWLEVEERDLGALVLKAEVVHHWLQGMHQLVQQYKKRGK